MELEIRPATVFEDLALLVGPKKPTSNGCYCLADRISAKANTDLRGTARAERVRRLCEEDLPPGIIAYQDDEPVGWAAVHPRSDTNFARSRTIPHIDDLDVWALWCFRVRPGYRKQGIMRILIDGAVAFAREHSAPAVEGYPVDSRGERVNLTMAYVGTRTLFENAGFTVAAKTTSTIDGFPRLLMRKMLVPANENAALPFRGGRLP